MKERNLALTLSLGLHASALLLVYYLSSGFPVQPKPIVIDFSLADQAAPGNGSRTPASGNKVGAPAPKLPGPPTPRPFVSTPLPAAKPVPRIVASTAPKETVSRVVTAPAQEANGPVMLGAAPRLSSTGGADGNARHSTTVAVSSGGYGGGGSGSGGGGGAGAGDGGGGSGSGSGSGKNGEHGLEHLRGKYRAEHFAYIKRIIQENIVYPHQARRLQWAGTCQISFLVLENGRVTDIKVLRSTGHELLDNNVVETVRRVAPFPRPPISVKLMIPFTYHIN